MRTFVWHTQKLFKNILWMFAKIGQNWVAELFISGIPSTLMFNSAVMFDWMFEKLERKLFSIPLYHKWPPATWLMFVYRGVFNRVRLSKQSQFMPNSFNILSRSLTDRLDILCCKTQDVSLFLLLIISEMKRSFASVCVECFGWILAAVSAWLISVLISLLHFCKMRLISLCLDFFSLWFFRQFLERNKMLSIFSTFKWQHKWFHCGVLHFEVVLTDLRTVSVRRPSFMIPQLNEGPIFIQSWKAHDDKHIRCDNFFIIIVLHFVCSILFYKNIHSICLPVNKKWKEKKIKKRMGWKW